MPRLAVTGYNRKYAMWLLSHAKGGQCIPHLPRPSRDAARSSTRVLHGLARRQQDLYTKRLMPFPPTLVEALEWLVHLQLDSGVPLTTAFYERCDSRSEARVPSTHEAIAVSSQPEHE